MLKKVKIQNSKERRLARVRGKLAKSPLLRVSVFKSNRYLYGQLIDDAKGHTIVSVGPKDGDSALELGKLLAARAKENKVLKVKYDRGAYKYHGKIKEFAEGLREGGLEV